MSAAPEGFWQTVRYHEAALYAKVAHEGRVPDKNKDVGKFHWLWAEDGPLNEAPPSVTRWVGMRRYPGLITMSRLVVRKLLSYESLSTSSTSDNVLETMYMYGGFLGMRARNRMLVVNSADRTQLDPDAPVTAAGPRPTAESSLASYRMGLMEPQPDDYTRVLQVLETGRQQDYQLPPIVIG